MTPKEKAKQLVDDFTYIDNGEMFQIIGVKQRIRAKQCALIAVNEILDVLDAESWGMEMDTAFDNQRFWKDVKKEIELM